MKCERKCITEVMTFQLKRQCFNFTSPRSVATFPCDQIFYLETDSSITSSLIYKCYKKVANFQQNYFHTNIKHHKKIVQPWDSCIGHHTPLQTKLGQLGLKGPGEYGDFKRNLMFFSASYCFSQFIIFYILINLCIMLLPHVLDQLYLHVYNFPGTFAIYPKTFAEK